METTNPPQCSSVRLLLIIRMMTLASQMNQVQSELRLARSLLAERDTEIQRVRTTNNQVFPFPSSSFFVAL